jgi:preprotein translocase subunit YajC
MGNMGSTILYFVVIIAVFYFFLIRPQKKKEKEQKNMIASLKKGDKVITIGGFHAKVVSSKNGIITVTIGDTKAKVEEWAIRSVEKTDDGAALAEEKIEEAEEKTEE